MRCVTPTISRIATRLVTLFFTVAAGAQVMPTTGTPVPGMASYDEFAESFMTRHEIPGGAIAVVRDGKLVFARAYGYANKTTGELVQPDSIFRIASLSKAITSSAILLLVQRGQLTLDQRVFDILQISPPARADPRLGTITVRELLQHMGGWNRDTTYDPMFRSLVIADATGTAPPAETQTIIRYMLDKPLQFAPGTEYNYSNFGYALLGRVIEVITGQPYERFVREQVLAFSGAACMRIGHSFATQAWPKEVRYYDYDGAPTTRSAFGTGLDVPRPDGGFYLEAMDSHGGWVASTIDYLRFVLSVDSRADHDDLLSAATIEIMLDCPTSYWSCSSPSTWYGMGWWVHSSRAYWWHFGSLAGTTTMAARYTGGVTWAVFFNSRPYFATEEESEKYFLELRNQMATALTYVTNWPSHDQFSDFVPCSKPEKRRRAVRH
jgi:CubicO group peptidase (beta-lactamase class C family)